MYTYVNLTIVLQDQLACGKVPWEHGDQVTVKSEPIHSSELLVTTYITPEYHNPHVDRHEHPSFT